MSQTPPNKKRLSRTDWERLMAEYEASSLTQRAFCEQHELTYSSFGYWRKRLRPSAPATPQNEPLFELSALSMGVSHEWRVELDLGQGLILRLK